MNSPSELTSRLTALTRDLVLVRSTDARPDERRLCVDLIFNHLDGLEGVSTQAFTSEGYTSVVSGPKNTLSTEVLLCGHLDVIDHSHLETYSSRIEDGRIYGPGAGDMKGALAIMLELFRELHQRLPGLPLGIAITSDEERGGANGLPFLLNEIGLRCNSAIVPDGGSLNELTVEEKGVLHLRVNCCGEEAHAARPWEGTNAAESLLVRLDKLKKYFESFGPLRGADSDDYWYPTCTITAMNTSNRTVNLVPDDAFATLDVRFPPPFNTESMAREIENILHPDCSIETIVSAEPTHLAPDELFCSATANVTGQEVKRIRASGGSDSRFFREFDIPVCLSRPLVGNIHSEHEWINIDSMETYYKICESYISQKLGLK